MYAVQPTRRRGGFTLVEMIVVMTIILMIAALGIAFLPRFLDNQMETRAVDQLTQWLLTAKMRAKRDGLPTGIRFIVDPNTGQYDQAIYMQQPEPYTAGVCTSIKPIAGTKTATFTVGGVDFQGAAGGAQAADSPGATGGGWLVQIGDYLQVNGGGPVYYIDGVSPSTLILSNSQVQLLTQTDNYRVIRQPRRLPGEDILQLPKDMIVDLSLSNPSDLSSTILSKNVPVRTIGTTANATPVPGSAAYEIVFSPAGDVIGQGTPSGKVLLWVRNVTKNVMDAGGNYDATAATLISVQIRTGFIAAHPIALGSDPYLFTEDGRSSGL